MFAKRASGRELSVFNHVMSFVLTTVAAVGWVFIGTLIVYLAWNFIVCPIFGAEPMGFLINLAMIAAAYFVIFCLKLIFSP